MSLNQPIVMQPRQVLKSLRTVWAAMLVWMGLVVFVAFRMHRTQVIPPSLSFQWGLAVMGALTAAGVLYLRFFVINGLFDRSEPFEDRLLARRMWMTHIFAFALSECTMLFGFALFVVRGDSKFYVPLYLGGVLLMLLCYPQLPARD